MKRVLFILLVLFVAAGTRSEARTEPLSKFRKIGRDFYLKGETLPYTGVIVDYYENGQLREESNIGNGLRHGETVTYYENGQKESVVNYYAYMRHGKAVTYYENGNIKSMVGYKNDKPQGEWVLYYENGQIKSKGVYTDGILSSGVSYSEDGEIMERNEIIYKIEPKEGLAYLKGEEEPYTGNVLDYHKGGSLKKIMMFKEGKLEGRSEVYYDNYRLALIANYRGGKLDGKMVEYYSNNMLKSKRNYKNGKLDREAFSFHKDGLWYRHVFIDGTLVKAKPYTGVLVDRGLKGQARFKGNYTEGKFDGEVTIYYSDGKPEIKANYRGGNLDGETIKYWPSGNIERKINYKDGKLIRE